MTVQEKRVPARSVAVSHQWITRTLSSICARNLSTVITHVVKLIIASGMTCHGRHCRCSLQPVGVKARMCSGNIWDNTDGMRIHTHAKTQRTPTKVLFGPTKISFQAAVGLGGGFRPQWDRIQRRGDEVSCQGLHDTVSGKMGRLKYISGKTLDETSIPLMIQGTVDKNKQPNWKSKTLCT